MCHWYEWVTVLKGAVVHQNYFTFVFHSFESCGTKLIFEIIQWQIDINTCC